MKRSRLIMLIITMLLIFSIVLSSCGPGPTEEPTTTEEPEPTEEEVVPTEAEEEPEMEPTESEETETEPTETEEVRIGVVLPLSGDGAFYGGLLQTGYEFATEQVNEQGGIESLGGAPIELVFGDHQGKAEVAVSEVERLVQTEDVSVVAGCEFSGVGLAMATAASRLQVPYVVDICSGDAITEQGLEYVFRLNVKGSWYGDSFVKLLDYINDDLGIEATKVAGGYKDTEAGQSFVGGGISAAEEAGYDIVFDDAYPPDIRDMTTYISRIRAAEPDVILANDTTAAGSIQFTETLSNLDVDPKLIVTVSGGYELPDWQEGVGGLKDGWVHIVQFRDTLPGLAEMEEAYAEFTDDQLTSRGLIAQQVIYTIAEGLESAGSRDPQEIRDALAELRIEPGPRLVMPWPCVEFDETGQNQCAQNLAVQWIDGNDPVVFPPDQGTQDLQVPFDYWESAE